MERKIGALAYCKSKISKGEIVATLFSFKKKLLKSFRAFDSVVAKGDSSPSQVHGSQSGTKTDSGKTGKLGSSLFLAKKPPNEHNESN